MFFAAHGSTHDIRRIIADNEKVNHHYGSTAIDDVLIKPVDTAEMAKTIRKVLSRYHA